VGKDTFKNVSTSMLELVTAQDECV
jgi:hypothetical protein